MKKTILLVFSFSLFVFHFSSAQTCQWARSAKGVDSDGCSGIAADASGNVYITGNFNSDTIQFGNTTPLYKIIPTSSYMYIAKYDPFGTAIWAIREGDGLASSCIVTDANANVYIAGHFGGASYQFGNTTPLININSSRNDIFIAKYDSSGNIIWARSAGGVGHDEAWSIAVDINNNVYITGHLGSPTIQFGNTPVLTGNGADDIFIAKYDSSGNVIWARSAGGADFDDCRSITVDSKFNIYIAGGFTSNTLQFGNTPALINNNGGGIGHDDTFIAKYDSSGNALWANCAGSTGIDIVCGLTADSANSVYISGYYDSPTLQFGNTPTLINTNPNHSMFFAKYNAGGNIIWAKNINGDMNSFMKADKNNNIYIVGSFPDSSIQFGNTPPLTNANYSSYTNDIYITRYDSSGNALWSKSSGGLKEDNSNNITIDLNGNIYIAGYFMSNTIQFGNTPQITNSLVSYNSYFNFGLSDIFVAKYSASDTIIETSSKIICTGGTSTTTSLYLNGVIQSTGIIWNWYSGSCGGIHEGSGMILSVNPTITTTYYVRAESTTNTSSCVSIQITVIVNGYSSIIPTTGTVIPGFICNSGSSTLGITGGSLGTSATWKWYSGYCGGAFRGDSSILIVNSPPSATYFVRAEGICNTTNCVSIKVIVYGDAILPTGILATPDTICNGNSSFFSLTGSYSGAWYWYSGSCGGTFEGNGIANTITVYPTTTTTYFLRAEGICGTTSCVSVELAVNVNSVPAISATSSSATVCSGSSATLGLSGGSLGTNANWIWHSNSCTGTPLGSGITLTVTPTALTTYYVRAEGQCFTTSCVSVTITFNNNITITNTPTICQGQSYFAGGTNQTINGTYYDSLQTTTNCDSIIITNLTVNPSSTNAINAAICQGQSYFAGGANQILSGAYYDSLLTTTNCDSIIITNLTVNPVYNIPITASINQGQTYTLPDGSIIDSTGVYTTLLQTQDGCDSIIVTTLTVLVSVCTISETNNLLIYPNPANETINIINAEKGVIHICNVLGEEVMNAKCNEGNVTVNISSLAVGTYILKVVSAKGVVVRKIVKN